MLLSWGLCEEPLLGQSHIPFGRRFGTTADDPVDWHARQEGLNYDKVLLAISDANPYLSEGSRQVCVTAFLLT